MADNDDNGDFEKVQALDTPELVAARWWKAPDRSGGPGVDRRSALLGLAGLTAIASLANQGCFGGSSEPPGPVDHTSLDIQKKHGWDFGAEGKTLSMGSDAQQPVDPAVLKGLSTTLTPKNPANRTLASLVLFDSVSQAPAATVELADVIRPIHTEKMEKAELAGRGMSTLFDGAPAGRAILVDLKGPESVAFAAGLANRFDPVFIFDNWPHPKGTVPSHLTLAAALDRASNFEELAKARPDTAPPAFILDANRLNPFNTEQFDNRYVAPLPSAETLKKMGVNEILLVRASPSDKELDDMNAVMVEWAGAGIPVKLVPMTRFEQAPKTETEASATEGYETVAETDASETDHYGTTHRHHHHHHYGGYGHHWFFWSHYGWGRSRYRARPTAFAAPTYTARRRATTFGKTARPQGFGRVAVDPRGKGGKPSLHTDQKKSNMGRGRSGRSGGRSGGSWGRSGGGGYS